MENEWYDNNKGEAVDEAVQQFIRTIKKKEQETQTYDNIFDWLKGRITKKTQIPSESSVLSKLRAKLARDPNNEYIQEQIRRLTGQ